MQLKDLPRANIIAEEIEAIEKQMDNFSILLQGISPLRKDSPIIPKTQRLEILVNMDIVKKILAEDSEDKLVDSIIKQFFLLAGEYLQKLKKELEAI